MNSSTNSRPFRPPQRIALLAPAIVLLLVSCSGRPGRVAPPNYATHAGNAAIERYDANGDGAIAGEELEATPGLKASLQQVDGDGDGRLTAQEIDARIQSWRDSRVAEMPVSCVVNLDGQPLAGAKVQFEPEPFLGAQVPPAVATTDEGGSASASMAEDALADPRYPGMACGWYRMRITGGNQTIPPRYNTETTLGCEVAVNAHWESDGALLINLTGQ